MASLDDLTLELPGWTQESQSSSEAIWRNEDGHGLGAYCYDIPPDIGASLEKLDELRAYYRDAIVGAGGGLVQADVGAVAAIPTVETIFKIPQEPSGMSYIASITIPFESFSFVIKTQCAEEGMTGMRDTVVFDLMMSKFEFDEVTGSPIGWKQDPYDPEAIAPVLRNRADDIEWDEKFPDHPLSRCRGYLLEAKAGLTLSDAVKGAPRFAGRPRAKKKSWWPFAKR